MMRKRFFELSRSKRNVRDIPPGKMVRVGSFTMHICPAGSGAPAVILDSGSGGFSLDWASVQPAIAQFTRVCSYDRAGHGWSKPAPHPQAIPNVAADLHALLENSSQPPPYVLVGHSLGGLYLHYFARRYPAETAGVILVDAAPPQMYHHLPPAYSRHNRRELLKRWLAALTGLMRLGVLRVPPDSESETDRIRAALMQRPAYWRALLSQNRHLAPGVDRIVAAAGPFPPVPLTVLTPARADWLAAIDPALSGLWQEYQRQLACLSPLGRLVIIEDSDHGSILEHARVVEAVQEMVTGIRG